MVFLTPLTILGVVQFCVFYLGFVYLCNIAHVKDTKTNNFFIENHICLLKKYILNIKTQVSI